MNGASMWWDAPLEKLRPAAVFRGLLLLRPTYARPIVCDTCGQDILHGIPWCGCPMPECYRDDA